MKRRQSTLKISASRRWRSLAILCGFLPRPETLGTEYDLACLLLLNGRTNEAAPLFQEVATNSRRRFGIEDGLTLGALRQLAKTLESNGQFAEAAKQYKAILDAHRRYYGPKHRLAIAAELELANQYIKLGRIDDVRENYTRKD